MTTPYKKKLIEVALPLEAINAASAREKSIRHGHPSTLHLWWARRPLAACRAVLFAQLVDDPSGYTESLLADPKLREQAEVELKTRHKLWLDRKDQANETTPIPPEPTLEDCAADLERKRLFAIIEDLVKWENSTNEEVLERARAEIRRSCGGELPPVYDPFSGGGSIPLEAQRLGLPAFGSDLNPVAVMIGKAMIEIPPKFKDLEPVHPGPRDRTHYRFAEGLAEDVRFYGDLMRQKAWDKVGHLYPQVTLPKEYGGGKANVIAWIWARTVPSPDPAFSDTQVPLVTNFVLSSKKGREAWIEPIVDKQSKSISYAIRSGKDKVAIDNASNGTKAGRAMFKCLLSGAPISGQYADQAAERGEMSNTCIALVAETSSGRIYLPPDSSTSEKNSNICSDYINGLDLSALDMKSRGTFASNAQGRRYCFNTFKDYFNDRQLASLATFGDLIPELITEIESNAKRTLPESDARGVVGGGQGARAYAEAIAIYLAFSISKATTRNCTLAIWEPGMGRLAGALGRQAFPMQWSYAETNPYVGAGGDISGTAKSISEALDKLVFDAPGTEIQRDAASIYTHASPPVISTDPPYYDNIEYADLSDFFYVWLRRNIRNIAPSLFETIAVPKTEQLVASSHRHGSKEDAYKFFMEGMTKAVKNIKSEANNYYPTTIYYAFMQSDADEEGIASSGWSSFLEAVLNTNLSIVGTWPLRTEATNALKKGINALATSVVLVCRPRESSAEIVTRAEFIRALKRELPPAIAELQAANIAPADMPQSAIGPGMGIFSRYKAVLEADDSPMTVRTALQLINSELDAFLGGIEGEFDPDTRFAITWFEQYGMERGEYGAADSLARARGISVESVRHAGIIDSSAGRVRLLRRDELPDEWRPEKDQHLTVWECLQHLVKRHESDGVSSTTAEALKALGEMADAVKDLAYCLYAICMNKRNDGKEASGYNALIADWADLSREAQAVPDAPAPQQIRMEF